MTRLVPMLPRGCCGPARKRFDRDIDAGIMSVVHRSRRHGSTRLVVVPACQTSGPSEALCLVAVLALIQQLCRNEDTCREMSADERRFLSLPIGSRPTAVVLPIPRVGRRACAAVRQVMVPFADPRREVPPPSVVERRHLGESCGLAVSDPIADPGLRASQEYWTAQAYTRRRDSSSAFRLHSSEGRAVITTERPGRRNRPDRSASHRQNPDDSGSTP
jgi:hypothetical protein